VEIFTVILRDAWGSAAEIPASVHIRVVDKAPPSILFPAKDKTGARESQAERSSLGLWPRPGPGLCDEVEVLQSIGLEEAKLAGAIWTRGRYIDPRERRQE